MKTRTITLTDRPPVRISEDAWIVMASASDSEHDGQVECQAFRKSKWRITVRQHDDGRTIVYAVYDYYTAWQNERCLHAAKGVLLPTDDESAICDAIKAVCADIAACEHSNDDADRWTGLADECIADMPAETL